MKTSHFPLTRDLVLVGGGHTHALLLRKWGMNPLPGVRITVINPGPTAPYSGMLPGFLAGHYDRADLDIDLVKLARFSGARIILGRAVNLEPDKRMVAIKNGPIIPYDIASIDVGITSEMPSLPGFSQYGIPAKPLGVFASAWEAFRQKDGPASIAIIGGGVAGAEIALAFAHSLQSRQRNYQITIVENGTALKTLRPQSRTKLIAATNRYNIDILENTIVKRIVETGVYLSDGTHISADFVCGAAGAHPQEWLQNSGLELHQGFVKVSPTLQSSNPAVFAVGDCAHMTKTPRPKAGVFAVRQAETLYLNLRSTLAEKEVLKRYNPQNDYLKLVSMGRKSALGDRFGIAFQGPLIWQWKNHIDQRFMSQFKDLPRMGISTLPTDRAAGVKDALGDKPLCGGCGSKIAQHTLKKALEQRRSPSRPEVVDLPSDDAALLCTGNVKQVISTDHLRAFVADPIAMSKIAANHALGDIWSMGALPQAATPYIILPHMTATLAARSLAEIMDAADRVFSEAGAIIAGGHSSFGCELTIGFTVTGICQTAPITLAGAKPGQSLVLTKPIGSGVVMAADMLGLAEGEWVAEAIDQMCQSQAKAARILRNASAMTDVTGFGLAGHLMSICQTSNVGADLTLDSIPLLSGALELAKDKIRSSLFRDNKQVLPGTPETPKSDLLFDPQAAGGLLATIDGDPSPVLNALQDAGYDAAIIGKINNEIGKISIC